MPTLFDPLHWHASKGTEASNGADGDVRLSFGPSVPWGERKRIRRVIAHYEGLLRLQLDVPLGTMTRRVRQLITAERVRVVDEKYKTFNLKNIQTACDHEYRRHDNQQHRQRY